MCDLLRQYQPTVPLLLHLALGLWAGLALPEGVQQWLRAVARLLG